MIISRTPFRVSFVGGGTDLRVFYSQEYGQVLSTAIDKYIYVAVKRQSEIAEIKYRINWSRVELKNSIDEIEHPIVREALKMLDIDFPCEVTTFADIPANSGLGSSSSFAVGLLHALYALKREMVSKDDLARQAGNIEIDILKRNMGKQDHYAAANGNLNVISFYSDEEVCVEPILISKDVREQLAGKLLLFYTRQKRDASEILKSQTAATKNKLDVLRKMRSLVPEMGNALAKCDLPTCGKLFHENWMLKKSITQDISSEAIDGYYQKAMDAGALGGKLLGAGGGGFLMFYVEEENQPSVIEALADLQQVDFGFDTNGTRITYYDQ